jgi:hypothetical protein
VVLAIGKRISGTPPTRHAAMSRIAYSMGSSSRRSSYIPNMVRLACSTAAKPASNRRFLTVTRMLRKPAMLAAPG